LIFLLRKNSLEKKSSLIFIQILNLVHIFHHNIFLVIFSPTGAIFDPYLEFSHQGIIQVF
jgi:hypothetical protein